MQIVNVSDDCGGTGRQFRGTNGAWMWIVPGLRQFRMRVPMGIFHRPRPTTLSDTLISNTVPPDQDATLIRSVITVDGFSLSLSYFSPSFSPLRYREQNQPGGERRERARNQTLHSEVKGGGGNQKARSCALSCLSSQRNAREMGVQRVFSWRRIYRDRLYPIESGDV